MRRKPEVVTSVRRDLTALRWTADEQEHVHFTLYALPVCEKHLSSTDRLVRQQPRGPVGEDYTISSMDLIALHKRELGTCGVGCPEPAVALVECMR